MQARRWILVLLFGLGLAARSAAWIFGSRIPVPYNTTSKDFQIYWNVPTFMCHKYGMNFRQVAEKYGILQNDADKFRGDQIAILYDPGDFPALLKDDKGSYNKNGRLKEVRTRRNVAENQSKFLQNKDNVIRRNGGVPQEGNLTLHLAYFRRHLSEQIPDPNFSGLGVIDFESWRPIFRQNWASLQIYRELSLDIERNRHPFWSQRAIQQEASQRFESAGRAFMQRSLEVARKMRPNASWGYYAYPYCFNWTPNQQSAQCVPKVVEENDEMSWLFGNADVLYPSVYLQQRLGPSQRVGLVRGRIQEAVRLAQRSKAPGPVRVLAYYWYKYQDQRDLFVDKRDIVNTIGEIAKRGADGAIIWGSSADLDSKAKCESFQNYLVQTLGPTILRLRQQLDGRDGRAVVELFEEEEEEAR